MPDPVQVYRIPDGHCLPFMAAITVLLCAHCARAGGGASSFRVGRARPGHRDLPGAQASHQQHQLAAAAAAAARLPLRRDRVQSQSPTDNGIVQSPSPSPLSPARAVPSQANGEAGSRPTTQAEGRGWADGPARDGPDHAPHPSPGRVQAGPKGHSLRRARIRRKATAMA